MKNSAGYIKMNIKIRAFHSSVTVYIYIYTSKSNIGRDGFLKFVRIMLYYITDERCEEAAL